MDPTLNHNDFEIIKKDILYNGIFRLVRLHLRHKLFDNTWSKVFTREVLERRRAAAVLPYDPKLDRVILIEQFRPGTLKDPVSPWQIEIPAGVLDNHNDDPEEVATREALEEAMCTVTDLQLLFAYFVSPGGSNEFIHVFFGLTDATNVNGIHGLAHEDENIRVINISADDAIKKLHNGEIKNAPTIIALQWLEANRERLKCRVD